MAHEARDLSNEKSFLDESDFFLVFRCQLSYFLDTFHFRKPRMIEPSFMQVVISETILLANLAVFEPGEGEANRRAAPALDSSLREENSTWGRF